MQKLVLSGIFLFLIVFPSYAFADGPYLNIPPTNAFDKIHSDNGTINAVNFSMPLNIIGGSGVSVKSQNGTHTVTITNTQAINTHTGTYNQTLANNVVKNSGGQGLNFINGTNNPINLVNDPTRNQINITISSTGGGGGGVTSLNALTGALTIACVSGNTTCTTSGGNTITVNTAWNIVTTGLNPQTITKGLTLNALTLGGNAAGGNKNFTALNNVNATKFFQGSNQVVDTITPGAGISAVKSGGTYTVTNTGVLSAITSVNSQTGPSISIVRELGNTTITNSTNQIKVGLGVNPVITGGSDQPITKSTFTINNLKLGGDENVGTNALTNSGHKSTLPLTSGTLCQTNQSSTCGTNSGVTSITGTAHNVTASSSTGAVTLNTGDNVFMTNGAIQNITKATIMNGGLTMSHSNINLGANAVNTTTYGISEQSVFGSEKTLIIQPTLPNLPSSFHLLPSTTGKQVYFQLWRNSNYTTNREYIVFGVDLKGVGEYDIFPSRTGTGVYHPINIFNNNVKVISFDAVGTISSYVQNIWTPIIDPVTAFTNAIWKSSTTTDVLKYRNNANTTTLSIVSTLSATNATTGQLSGNGTGTTSTTLVMDGVYATLTPANTGRITVTVSGGYKSSVTSDGCIIGIRQSTSNMGANGVAVAGTALGNNLHFLSAVGGDASGFSRTYDFTGTVGTKYFFDLAFARITGGTCTLQDINWDLVEH